MRYSECMRNAFRSINRPRSWSSGLQEGEQIDRLSIEARFSEIEPISKLLTKPVGTRKRHFLRPTPLRESNQFCD